MAKYPIGTTKKFKEPFKELALFNNNNIPAIINSAKGPREFIVLWTFIRKGSGVPALAISDSMTPTYFVRWGIGERSPPRSCE
jgi:hypothetical protein